MAAPSSAHRSRPLAGGRAALRTAHDGQRTLRIGSVLDHELVDAVIDDLRRAVEQGERLLVDLRFASLLNPRPLRRLLRTLGALGFHSALLCGRVSAQMLLQRWGIDNEVVVLDDRGETDERLHGA